MMCDAIDLVTIKKFGRLLLWYRGPTHRGGKSGCKLVTLFDSYSYDVVSAGIWVIHTGPKSGGHAF